MPFLSTAFNAARRMAAPLIVAGACLAQPSFAGETDIASRQTPQSMGKDKEPEIVDRFLVYAIDVSGSIEIEEYLLMMKGMADAFRSEDMKMQLRQGLKFGVGTIFFCDEAKFGVMEVIRNEEDAEYFADKAFWNNETNLPYNAEKCGWTNLAAPLAKAQELFAREKELRFTSLERSLVLLGDGANNPNMNSNSIKIDPTIVSRTLSVGSNAVVYGIPVTRGGDEDLVAYYKSLATPKGTFSLREDGRKIPLKEGRVTPSPGFAEVTKAVKETFMLNMY